MIKKPISITIKVTEDGKIISSNILNPLVHDCSNVTVARQSPYGLAVLAFLSATPKKCSVFIFAERDGT